MRIVILVDKIYCAGGISFDGVKLFAGIPPSALAVLGGSMPGQLAARDGEVQQLRDDLKETANQLASAVNAAYGAYFFQVPPAAGLLALHPSISVDSLRASASSDAGANALALSIAGIGHKSFSLAAGDLFNGTITGHFEKTVSGLGEALASVTTKADDQQIVEQMLTKQRDAVSSVSIDEEMADLMKFHVPIKHPLGWCG